MTSEEFESTSSGFVRKTRNSLGSSTRSSGEGESMNEMRRDSRHGSTTERQRRRKTVSFRNDGSWTNRRRAVAQRPIFRAQSIDPKADRAIVADAVDFVVSASSKGCVSLVSKIAEQLKYKISLEQKVISLSKELQRSQPRSSIPITIESQASRLTKPSVNETKLTFDLNCELLLPGAVPYPDTASNNGHSLTHPPTLTVSQFQDRGFGKENRICSLPQISPNNDEPSRISKSCSDSATQTIGEDIRKPVMIERGCSPIPLVDLENGVEEQINLVLLEKQFQKQVKTYHNVETQTQHDIISRKDKLIERECSPDHLVVETVTQLHPKKSENKNKVYPSISNKKHKYETLKSAGDLSYLPSNKSRPSSALSATNHSSKSFPGVKNTHNKCPCSTCKMQRKGLPRLKKK